MAVAQSACSPVIIISGLTPPKYLHRGGQQVMEQARIAAPVTKEARELLYAEHLWEDVAQAFRTATSGTPGPVSLSIPTDVLNEKVSVPERRHRGRPASRLRPNGAPSESFLAEAKALIAASKRPVIIVGSQAWRSDLPADLLPTLQKWNAPVFTIEQAQGMIPENGQTGFGYADPFFNATFRELTKADLIILAGAQIDFHTCFGGPQLLNPAVKILQIHPDPTRLDLCVPADIAVCGDPAVVLSHLARTAPLHSEASNWLKHLQEAHANKNQQWHEMLGTLFWARCHHRKKGSIPSRYAWRFRGMSHQGRASSSTPAILFIGRVPSLRRRRPAIGWTAA